MMHIEMATKTTTVKVRDVYEAVKKNGLEWVRGQWFDWKGKGNPIGACVLGQAAFNLRSSSSSSTDEMFTPNHFNLFDQLNRFPTISEKWRRNNISVHENGYENGCGTTIVFWNDKLEYEGETYVLKTYEEVTQMVYDVLEPYFDEEITLQHFDYSNGGH